MVLEDFDPLSIVIFEVNIYYVYKFLLILQKKQLRFVSALEQR